MRFCVIARNLLGYLALKTEYDLGERVVVRLGRGDLRDRRQPEEIARGRYVNLAESLAERCLELTNQLIARQSRCPSLRLLTRGQTDELLQVARRAIVRALNRTGVRCGDQSSVALCSSRRIIVELHPTYAGRCCCSSKTQ